MRAVFVLLPHEGCATTKKIILSRLIENSTGAFAKSTKPTDPEYRTTSVAEIICIYTAIRKLPFFYKNVLLSVQGNGRGY